MVILIVNAGSSSVKYQLFDMPSGTILAKGLCERIGMGKARITHSTGVNKNVTETDIPDHETAFTRVFEHLVAPPQPAIRSLSEIHAVGHRVLHGGASFTKSVIIDEEAIAAIEANIPLGPLHNPANLSGIRVCQKLLPDAQIVAVFDTAFHQTMPPKAYLYAIPYRYYTQYGIRKYGFHGTSYRFASQQAAQRLGTIPEQTKLIICHLGNGASVCAVDGGRSVDTSMGLSPLEGLVMGTRSGDIDPAVIETICERDHRSLNGTISILNKESGFLGLSGGLSSDCRDIEAAMMTDDERAKRAMEVFTYRIRKYIGAYIAVMNGVDAIVFTGGIGEHSHLVRRMVLADLSVLGIEVDAALNEQNAEYIHAETSKVKVMIIPANEELAIAEDTYRLMRN